MASIQIYLQSIKPKINAKADTFLLEKGYYAKKFC